MNQMEFVEANCLRLGALPVTKLQLFDFLCKVMFLLVLRTGEKRVWVYVFLTCSIEIN